MSHDADVLTVPEAATYLRVSRTTAYKLIREGRVPNIRIGTRMLVPRSALQRWLDETASASVDREAS